MAAQILGDGLPQWWDAALIGVKGVALVQGFARRGTDKLGRWYIALTRPERNQAGLLLPVVEHRHDTTFWQCRRHGPDGGHQPGIELFPGDLGGHRWVHGTVALSCV